MRSRSGVGRALVVEDGQSRGVVGAVRALAGAGWSVGLAAPVTAPAAFSRAVRHRHLVPSLEEGTDAFLAAVAAAVRDQAYDVVFGAGDAELYALSAGRSGLDAVVPYPPHPQVLAALDKEQMRTAASAAGLRTPESLPLDALEARPGPFVVKPATHGGAGGGAVVRVEAHRVPDAQAARDAVREIEAVGGTAVVQEALTGDLHALVVLLGRDGQLVAAAHQRAERLQPPAAGVSARAVTVPVDEGLAAQAADFLRASGWWGLAELQFLPGRDGQPSLIDVNGRFYGSLALAVASGVNLPDLWGRSALGLSVPSGQRGRAGVRYQWLEGDLRAAAALREGGLLRDLGGTLQRARTSVHSTLSLRDPGPALWAGARLAGRGVRKAAQAR